jgi:2-methylcitrate dehydratase PrpD
VRDPRLLAVAAKVRYEIDPANPYPTEFTGHLRVHLKDGRVLEERQAHFRGGAHEPLSRAELEQKFRLNCAHGGWRAETTERYLAFVRGDPVPLSAFR